MKRTTLPLLLTLALLAGCATLASLTRSSSAGASELWNEGMEALALLEFERAERAFTRLAEEHGNLADGRESLFYLGLIRLDPRNPEWNTRIAEDHLTAYLAQADEGYPPRRQQEARTFHEIARQLNLPPYYRVAGLQPEERVITIEERVLVPAEQSREMALQIDRLQRQIVVRDSTIRAQQEELERIRRTLTGSGRD